MAKRFRIHDKQGNVVPYDISSASITIDAEGKSLDVKLSELVTAIAGAIKSITFNGNSPTMDDSGNVNLGYQLQANWNESNQNYPSYIQGKPNLASVATTGDYNDLRNKPTIPQGVEPDSDMSDFSDAPVKNRVIKAYVDNLISGLVNGAPQALDTLNELAAALGNNSNFAATITQQLANIYTKAEVNGLVANAGKVQTVSINGGNPVSPDNNGNVDLGNVVGAQGKSAYDIAVDNGYTGTEAAWLASLKGEKGDQGDTLLVDGEFNPVTDIVNDMTTGGTNKAWSAEMGKELAEEVNDIPVIDIRMVGSKLVINTNAALSPRVTIGALSSNTLSCRAGQTATATFQVSGRHLTAAIFAALSDSTHFSISSASVSPTNGSVAPTTLTVTYNPGNGATAGTTHSLTITIRSDDVDYGTLTLTGTVAAAPSITLTPATLTIGTESGQSATGTINVKGNALDGDITLAISGSGFSLSTNSVSKAEAESANGKDITVTFDGSADDAHATITASSTGATNATAEVTGDIAQRLNAGDTFSDNDFTYTVLTDTTKVGIKGKSASTLQGAITLPSSATYNGLSYEVVEITAGGFASFTKITSITFPSSIKTVRSQAFYNTTGLTHIDLGEVETFDAAGFNYFSYTGLEEITLPYTIKVFKNFLRDTTHLKTIILGDAVHGFGSGATNIGQMLQYAGSTTDDSVANTLTKVICYATTPPTIGYVPNGMALAGTTLYVPAASLSAYQAHTQWSNFPNISTIESLNQ